MSDLRLTAFSFDQVLAGDDPPERRKLRSYRRGDIVEPRDKAERERLITAGVVEETSAPSGDGAADEIAERRKAAEAERSGSDGPPVPPDVGEGPLEGRTVAQLRALAVERNVEGRSELTTKPQLLAALAKLPAS